MPFATLTYRDNLKLSHSKCFSHVDNTWIIHVSFDRVTYGAAWWIFNKHLRAGSEVHEPWPRRSKISETVPFIRRVPLLFPDRSQTEETEGSILTLSLSLSLFAQASIRGEEASDSWINRDGFPFHWTCVIVSRLRQWACYPRVITRGGRARHAHTRKGTINSSNAAEGGGTIPNERMVRVRVCVCRFRSARRRRGNGTTNPVIHGSWALHSVHAPQALMPH